MVSLSFLGIVFLFYVGIGFRIFNMYNIENGIDSQVYYTHFPIDRYAGNFCL